VKRFLTLTELAERHGLGSRQQDQLGAVLGKLASDQHAPTSVREPARALEVHLADSLAAAQLEEVRGAGKLADLGSGAGMPGAVLAIALPSCAVSLIESQARRCGFLRELIEVAGLANASVVCKRAEEWRAGVGTQDVVCARALAPQPVVLEYAAPLLRLGGVLVDWRGRREAEEERESARAASELGLEPAAVLRVTPYPHARDLNLHLFVKVSTTPERFPRRAGVARKRPLGR
jgi:16S rRNA (guanine527-N7)-methyltransferase